MLRTRDATNPVYIQLEIGLRAIEYARAVSDRFRIPRPTREADHFVEGVKLRTASPALSQGMFRERRRSA